MNYLPNHDFAVPIPDQETNEKVQKEFFDLGVQWLVSGQQIINNPVARYQTTGAIQYHRSENVLTFGQARFYQNELIPIVHPDLFLYGNRQTMMITPRR